MVARLTPCKTRMCAHRQTPWNGISSTSATVLGAYVWGHQFIVLEWAERHLFAEKSSRADETQSETTRVLPSKSLPLTLYRDEMVLSSLQRSELNSPHACSQYCYGCEMIRYAAAVGDAHQCTQNGGNLWRALSSSPWDLLGDHFSQGWMNGFPFWRCLSKCFSSNKHRK